MNERNERTVANFACATMLLASHCAQAGVRCHGTETDQKYIKRVKQRMWRSSSSPHETRPSGRNIFQSM